MIIVTFKNFLEQELIHTFQKKIGARSDSLPKNKGSKVLVQWQI